MKKIVYLSLATAIALPSLSYAWSPNASEIIARSALHAVRRDFGDALANNEAALVEGCSLPLDVITNQYVRESGLGNPALTVDREINVLRDIARLQFTEYAAFRFGVLGRIAAEITMPFGFPKDDMERSIKDVLDRDIDKVLSQMRYQYEQRQLVYSPSTYFAEQTRFMDIAEKRIAADYQQGVGFKGYARRAVPEYYRKSTSAMADVWFTILKDVQVKIISKRQYIPPPAERMKFFSSRSLLVDYFADEVIYFIEKGDMPSLVEESYLLFTMFNQDAALSKPYERLGDAFMAANDGDRAILEYRRGLNLKPTWNEVRNKIVRYYLTVGQTHLDSRPQLPEYDPLEKALAAYKTLLEVDASHPLGNQKKNEVELAIAARERRRNWALELVDKARAVEHAANEIKKDRPVQAIVQYKNAIALFNNVSDEFQEHYEGAQNGISRAEKEINEIFAIVISSAEDVISQAQQSELNGNWAGAVQSYNQVPGLLGLFDNKQFEGEYGEYYQSASELKASAERKRKEAQTSLEALEAAAQP